MAQVTQAEDTRNRELPRLLKDLADARAFKRNCRYSELDRAYDQWKQAADALADFYDSNWDDTP